mgnify:CR=1 FL=1
MKQVVADYKAAGLLLEQEDALWFAADRCGCEKPEVLVRANGIPTYRFDSLRPVPVLSFATRTLGTTDGNVPLCS